MECHLLATSCTKYHITVAFEYGLLLTLYSSLNSFSILLSRRNSQESSNAVNRGSLEDKDIKEGEVRARYALILDCECLNESVSLDDTHSSHPHLPTQHKAFTRLFFINLRHSVKPGVHFFSATIYSRGLTFVQVIYESLDCDLTQIFFDS